MDQTVRLTFKQFMRYYRVRLFDEEWDLEHLYGMGHGYFGDTKYVTTCAKWNIDKLYDWFKSHKIPSHKYRECIQEAVTTKDYYLTIVVSDDSTEGRMQQIVQTLDRYIIEFGILDRLKYRLWLWANRRAQENIREKEGTEQFLRSMQKDVDFHLNMARSYTEESAQIMNGLQKGENDREGGNNMAEYIDRQDATADVVPVVHGSWVDADISDIQHYRCTACGYIEATWMTNFDYHFCPNCGAKMDEGIEMT